MARDLIVLGTNEMDFCVPHFLGNGPRWASRINIRICRYDSSCCKPGTRPVRLYLRSHNNQSVPCNFFKPYRHQISICLYAECVAPYLCLPDLTWIILLRDLLRVSYIPSPIYYKRGSPLYFTLW